MVDSWIVGVILCVFGNVAINIGTNITKTAHDIGRDSPKKDPSSSQPTQQSSETTVGSSPSHETLWGCGITLFAIGNLLNFIAFGFAAQILLAGLSSIQFVCNILFSYFIHGEALSSFVLLGTLLIVVGNVLVVLVSSSSASPEMLETTDFADNFAENTVFIVYFVITIFSSMAFQFYFHVVYTRLVEMRDHSAQRRIPDAPHLVSPSHSISQISFTTLVATTSTLPDVELKNRIESFESRDLNSSPSSISLLHIKLLPILYSIQSAMIGSYSVILAKALSSLLRTSFAGDNQLAYVGFYIILAIWGISMSFWLIRMNKALKMFHASIIIPTLQVFWIVFSITGGGIYYQEFAGYSVERVFSFIGSVILILLGVCILSGMKRGDNEPEVPPLFVDVENTLSFSQKFFNMESGRRRSDVP